MGIESGIIIFAPWTSKIWDLNKDIEYHETYALQAEQYLNDLLFVNKNVVLKRDVLGALNIKQPPLDCWKYGWIYREEDRCSGKIVIDFHMRVTKLKNPETGELTDVIILQPNWVDLTKEEINA